MKYRKYDIKKIILMILFILFVSIDILYIYRKYDNRLIKNINLNIGKMDSEGKHQVNVVAQNATLCLLDSNEWKNIKDCNYLLEPGTYTLYIRNKYNVTSKQFDVVNKPIGTFKTSIDSLDTYYIASGGRKKLNLEFDYPEFFNKTPNYSVENPDIIEVKDDTIIGLKSGESKLKIQLKDGNEREYNIVVTDLITPPSLNNNKPYLPCDRYTVEEAHLLDKILESRVKEYGEGTRGGVLAAARFITLEFPYTLRYFNENGRLVDHGIRKHIDGEGRYYHKGLYLSRDKFELLEKNASTKTGPNIWGCNIYDYFVSRMNQNGFTCSGFVSWAMLNGGFDVGDVGAGDYKQYDDDLSDLGEHQEITYDYMRNGNYEVGDFIARSGHAALIIGIDDNTIYTAESLPPKLKVYTYERYQGIIRDPNLTYVIEMKDKYPNGEGIYTRMWNE